MHGLTLGKYGDAWDNTSEDTAGLRPYNPAPGEWWSMDTIGHHVVRNNTIAPQQAGIAGSLGHCDTITGNTIHDIPFSACSRAPKWRASRSHRGGLENQPPGSLVQSAGSGWTGWRRALRCGRTFCEKTPARTCLW